MPRSNRLRLLAPAPALQVPSDPGPAAGLAEYIREVTHDGRLIVDYLRAAVLHSHNAQERAGAAALLLAYGLGKPVQPIEASGPGGGPLPLTVVPFDYAATVAELAPGPVPPPLPTQARSR